LGEIGKERTPIISFTSEPLVRQRDYVRWFPSVCLFLSLATIWAEDNERRLIDRLLRPDMHLQNSAQGKEFAAANSHFTARSSTTTIMFPVAASRTERSFTGTRGIATDEYNSRSFQIDSRNAPVVQDHNVNLPGQLRTSVVRGLRETHDTDLELAGRTFAGQREFREHGKSQKSLDRQNPPLTIDQVRELLNKNK
jgi:hypothetical protein